MRVIDYFDRGATFGPDRPCLVSDERSTTYAETARRSNQIAKALLRDGFTRGEKAAVIGPNAVEPFECILGIFRAELAWVPVNYRNGVDENCYVLHQFDVAILFFHSETAEQVKAFRERCPNVRRYICIDRPFEGLAALDPWVDPYDGPAPPCQGGRDDIVTISPTGGTTGKPKGVTWSNLTWQTMIANQIASQPCRTPPVHLVVAPMTHAAGVIGMVMMSIGATNVILRGFDPKRVIDAIAAHRVTHLFLPPTALYGLLAHPDVRKGDYSSLLYFTYGAAPTSTAKIREAVEVFGPCMQTLFGQVEAPASCTCLPPWELVENGVLREDRLASCGRRMLLTQVEIMDDDGCLLPAGQPGEIVVQGNLVMRGYYKNEAATAEVSVNGWHHTGDIGYFNDEGYLFIVDRKKDMIISGGFNIYPSEIEQVLSAHPDVHQCAVIGIPDDKWGEAVHAVVQLKPGARADAGELIAAMKDKLGSVKAPKGIDFVDELPRTGAGKISKKDLRARYWEGVGRNI
jgi:acyl-CoA synthetase (AMP-forming)/AMP-acid ligase II